jgi:CelD/BcsL family acetyltransferase involved in cellulose biosynthesis
MSNPRRYVWSLEPLTALEAARSAWHALAETALEPNPFYAPDYLLASRALGNAHRLKLLVARPEDNPERLAALFPLQPGGWRQGWLPGLKIMAQNPYSPLSTPLIAADTGPDLFESLLAAVPRLLPGSALLLPLLTERREAWAGFSAALAQAGRAHEILQRQTRAAIETNLSFADYVGRHNQSLLRRERKLTTHGRLNYVVIEGNSAAGDKMLESFLDIEARGWKGRRHTALASRAESLAFARQAFAGTSPKVLYECLLLNDQPLAVNVNLLAGGVLYTVKAAFDEDYRGYSPGNLLDRHTIALSTANESIRRVDSCAQPGHPLEQRWRETETISTVLVDWSGIGTARLQRMVKWLTLVEAGVTRLSRWRQRWRGRPSD